MSFVQRITRIPTVISPKGLVDGASGREGSAVYGDEARTRMAPDASSRGWGKAVYSEAAQRRRDGREELEDHGVLLVLFKLELGVLGLAVDVRLRLLGVVAEAERDG